MTDVRSSLNCGYRWQVPSVPVSADSGSQVWPIRSQYGPRFTQTHLGVIARATGALISSCSCDGRHLCALTRRENDHGCARSHTVKEINGIFVDHTDTAG